MKIVEKLRKSAAYEKVSRHFRYATLVEGLLQNDHFPFRCLFVDNSSLTEYLLPKIFETEPRILKKWIIWVPSLKKLLKDQLSHLDMCIAVLPLQWETKFHGLYDYRAQGWVRQVIDISDSEHPNQERAERSLRKTEKQINKHGFSYRITNDLEGFNFFYYKMYLPLIKKKFGALSEIEPYEDMRKIFLTGHLLQVIQDGKVIAGSVNIVTEEGLIGRRIGVLDGREDLTKIGAQSVIYYFAICYSRTHGIKKLDLLGSLPFFKDGVYSYKRDWGASVYPFDESNTWVYFFNPRYSEKTVSFFRNNPLIIQTNTGLTGLVGLENGSELSDVTKKDLVKRFYAPGLQGLQLLVPHSRIPVGLSFREEGTCL
jgi:hypothetical protein